MIEKNVPKLRFPGFIDKSNYDLYSFNDLFLFSTGKNIKQSEAAPEYNIPCVRYGELYHMYGAVINNVINRTNLNKNELLFSDGDEILIPSAGEDPLDIGAASALTIADVAIGRTINILKPSKTIKYSPNYVSHYINERLRVKISTLAKGVSISNVYNSDLKTLNIVLPSYFEQKKVADYIAAIQEKLDNLKKKKSLLEHYKKGMMQKIFNQELRFKDDDGKDFGEWEEQLLSEITTEPKIKNNDKLVTELFSVAKHRGVINQVEHLGRSFSAASITGYKIIDPYDLAYTKSPTTGFPYGIIKQNLTGRKGMVSPLYCVFKPDNKNIGFLLHNYFMSEINTYNYLNPIVEKGAKNTMNINNDVFLNGAPIYFPTDEKEQTKIANFLSAIDAKINLVSEQIENCEIWKKGLLREMFV